MDIHEKPVVTVPEGQPPTDLVVEDLVVGDGAEAGAGQQVTVDYCGVSWSTGNEFDASWNRNDTFTFGLGAGQVIAGWDQGVQGMRIGGRRRLTIPPHLGYGAQGASAKDAVAGFVPGPDGRLEGGLVSSSRAILYPAGSDTSDAGAWERAVDAALDRAISDLGEAL